MLFLWCEVLLHDRNSMRWRVSHHRREFCSIDILSVRFVIRTADRIRLLFFSLSLRFFLSIARFYHRCESYLLSWGECLLCYPAHQNLLCYSPSFSWPIPGIRKSEERKKNAIAMARRRLPLHTVHLLLWGLTCVCCSPDHHPSRSSVVGYATATHTQ